MELRDIQFGYADARTEAEHNPKLLLEAYYEPALADALWNDEQFLVLGPKGAGKSAIAWRLQLEAKSDPTKFVKVLELGQFPFKSFAKIRLDSSEEKSSYSASWKYLLYVQMLQQVIEDQSLQYSDYREFSRFVDSLRYYNVLPAEGLDRMVTKSKTKKFQMGLRSMLQAEFSETLERGSVDLLDLLEVFESRLNDLSSDSEYRLIIDGLDDLLSDRNNQFEIIAALVYAVKTINETLRTSALDAKVILLVRSDVYEKLPDSNLNKVQRDYGLKIEWYDEVGPMSESRLLKLVNLRAKISCDENVNVVHRWLPRSIRGKNDVEKYLLELTRHRPRDIIQLFNELKGCSSHGRLTEGQVFSAEKRYSRDYLLREMRDEVRGLLDDGLNDVAFEIVFSIRKAEFSLEDAYQAADQFGVSNREVIQILRQLFECGMIGMKDVCEARGYTTFKYRSPAAVFSTAGMRYIIHRGIRKAANLASA